MGRRSRPDGARCWPIGAAAVHPHAGPLARPIMRMEPTVPLRARARVGSGGSPAAPLGSTRKSVRSLIDLAFLVDIVATTLGVIDAERPVGSAGRFKPGIGPLTENELIAALLTRLAADHPLEFGTAGPRGYPGSRAECDVVIPGAWAIEIKLARPFGDNGRPAERWSENLLYPYSGNTSSIGDALKLLGSQFSERKVVMVIGYEHTPPKVALEPAVRSFELIASGVVGIALGPRSSRLIGGLIHPSHQQVTVYAWEVLGWQSGAT